MKHFSQLFKSLDQTTKTTEKVNALINYFGRASDQDKIWAIALFSHKRPRRTVSTTLLREWAAEKSGIPQWLFEETYHVVGDLAETIAKIIPDSRVKESDKDLGVWIDYIIALKDQPDEFRKSQIMYAWDVLNGDERFLFNKIITGGFRVGVSQRLVTKALAKHTGLEENIVAHRLMGNWDPVDTSYESLILTENENDNLSRPYPFYLAYAVEGEVDDIGDSDEWAAEWKWDGIRGQLIRRKGQLFLWSRGEELVTDKYPELSILAEANCPDFVIDGEILAFKDDIPLKFQELQKRIGRKSVSKKLMKEIPIVIMAYDILELDGIDLRDTKYVQRRIELSRLIDAIPLHHNILKLSQEQEFTQWSELKSLREISRQRRTEGFMLKRKDSVYKTGRKKGDWWKWKIDPMTIDAVMIYAMRGHGRRANLYTDFTFAVWNDDQLISFTKAYSGLTDDEFKKITYFVTKNTIDRFGPVRAVKPELVFEIAFEGIQESKRHKSGIALRFPRIKRWRTDKVASEANTIEDLRFLLDG